MTAGPAILLVEDEAVNRALLRAVLGRHPRLRDARLVEAPSLAEARGELARSTFDLVVLDIRLPDGDGLDLARELSSTDPRPRILVLSANIQEERRHQATAAGADAFMGKPYRPGELGAAMEELLGTT